MEQFTLETTAVEIFEMDFLVLYNLTGYGVTNYFRSAAIYTF